MNYQNHAAIIENLRKQLRQEEERYKTALRNNHVFWELKEIYQRIKTLKFELKSIIQHPPVSFA
jgi:hypothetical protein